MGSKIDFQYLYKTIRNRIYTLEYPPGEALREEDLAREFNVSRTPIRQVLQTLEYEGLVTSKPGIGSIVTIVDLKALKDVYAFRLRLAELVGELTHPRVTGEHIQNLETIMAEVLSMKGQYDPKSLALLYLRFHEQMMELITNSPLRKVYDQTFHLTSRVWLQILPELDWDDEVRAFYEEVRDVTKALKANDMCAVSAVRRNHMALLLVRVNRYLGSADNGG